MLENSWIGWGYYLLGALGLWLVWWRITRALPLPALRLVLRVAVLALLVCPYSIGDGYTQQAPAVLMLALETVFEGPEAFQRVGPTLLMVVGVAVVLALVLRVLLVGLLRGRQGRQVAQSELEAGREELLQQSHELRSTGV